MRMLLRLVLEHDGFRVMEATNESELVQCLAESCLPDLIIYDSPAPLVTGELLVDILFEMEPSLPIVITGTDTSDAHRRPNVIAVVQKPFSATHMVALVKGAILGSPAVTSDLRPIKLT